MSYGSLGPEPRLVTSLTVTPSQIARALRNGFHDAILGKISIDYLEHEATLELNLWIGDLDSKVYEDREKYRQGVLTLVGLEYFTIPSPDPKYSSSGSSSVDLVETDEVDGNFTGGFFVSNWNTTITFSAKEAHFAWSDSGEFVP